MSFEKSEFSLIDEIIKLIGLKEFRSLLLGKVYDAFEDSFRSTQEEFDFRRTKPDPNAFEYLKQRSFVLSQKTIDRLHGDLRLNLLEGIQNNYSIKEMIEKIRSIFDRMMDYELERIARTETINAMNAGRLNAYEKSGVVKYLMWKAHKDARTSSICRRLDGQIVKVGELFTDPETGEQFRHPPAHPNCRSTIIPLIKLPEVTYRSGYKYMTKIEIDIESLAKQEKYKKRILVHRRGQKPFYREQLVGRKETEKKVSHGSSMTPENIKNIKSGYDMGIEGSLHEEQLYIVTFKDDSKGVYKVLDQFDERIGEISYYKASKAIGWDICPETVDANFSKGRGSCQRFIEDGKEPYDGLNGEYSVKIDERHFDDLSKIFVMDAIAGNFDRHSGNVIIKNDKCYTIDNEDWGYDKRSARDFMAALDDACGGYKGSDWRKIPMMGWLKLNLNVDQQKKFKEYVMKNLKVALENDWDIENVYERYRGYPDIALRAGVVSDNIDYLKEYLRKGEKS